MLLPINGKKGEEAIQVLRWNNLKDIMSVGNARCRIIYCATICGEKERGGDENHSRVKEKERGRGGAGGESATVFTTLPAWAQPFWKDTPETGDTGCLPTEELGVWEQAGPGTVYTRVSLNTPCEYIRIIHNNNNKMKH